VGSPSATESLEDVQLAFTRNGGFDAGGAPLPPQRIGYRLRLNKLELLRWTALDSAPYNVPTVDVVLEGVSEFNVRHLTSRMTWEKQWPPVGRSFHAAQKCEGTGAEERREIDPFSPQ
jgi:type II secretion system protein J